MSLPLIVLALASMSAGSCPVAGAKYIDSDNPAVVAQARMAAHGAGETLYFTISDQARHTLWFTFDSGSALSSRRLISSKTDPGARNWKPQDPDTNEDRLLPDLRYFLFDARHRVVADSLHGESRAPAYIFVPDLGETLFYKREPGIFQTSDFTGMFKRSACGHAK